jgi:2-haloacid dehalogenase
MEYPRAIVFDLLTALLDSWKVWDSAAGDSTNGRKWRARYLELTYGSGIYQPYEKLVARSAVDTGLPPSATLALLKNWDALEPWPEVPEILAKLKFRGILIGVVTNCSIELGNRAAERCGVVFDGVVTAEEAGFYKPSPKPYVAILEALGVTAAETLFVAGSSADVPGAMGVGMEVVWHNRVQLVARPGSLPPRHEGQTLDEALRDFL